MGCASDLLISENAVVGLPTENAVAGLPTENAVAGLPTVPLGASTDCTLEFAAPELFALT